MRTNRGRRTFNAAGWVIAAGGMFAASRMWRLHLREVEQRAEEAVRTREEAARRRAMEERLRIARDLHDSLTHSISVICVQAGVAVHLARKRGEDVPQSLLAIQEAGADASRELRTTLSVLRSEEDDRSGLGHVNQLVERARAAGLPVTVTVTGAERLLPPEADQAAYRIVQEALTNVSRHAGHVRTSVHLDYAPDVLSIQVDDDGPGSSNGHRPAGTGQSTGPLAGQLTSKLTSQSTGQRPAGTGPGLGLIGMRERVTALGGRLSAGPRDGGGFRVRAEIPARTSS